MPTLTLDQAQVTDLDALEMLADSLTRLTGGGEVTVRSQVVVETENMPAFFLLKDLLGKKPTGTSVKAAVTAVVAEQQKRRGRKPKAAGETPTERTKRAYHRKARIEALGDIHVPEPAPAPHELQSWGVILPGQNKPDEWITVTDKNLRLAHGDFEPGTMLLHRGGSPRLQLITGDKGTGQGMEPVEAGAA